MTCAWVGDFCLPSWSGYKQQKVKIQSVGEDESIEDSNDKSDKLRMQQVEPPSGNPSTFIVNGDFAQGLGQDGSWQTVFEPNTVEQKWSIQYCERSQNTGFYLPYPSPSAMGSYAIWEAKFNQPSSTVLYQDISIPNDIDDFVLSFAWFAMSARGNTSLHNPSHMSANMCRPNFQFRVDLVPVGFKDWFSKDTKVIRNLVPPAINGSLMVDQLDSTKVVAGFSLANFALDCLAGKKVRLAFRAVSALEEIKTDVNKKENPDSILADSLVVGVSNVEIRHKDHMYGSGWFQP